jgi:anti-sigma B factor antagonist
MVLPSEPPLYDIALVRDEARLRILLRGEFDAAARPALEQVFLDLDPSRLERVLVDIRQVTFFDTTGLNMAYRLASWGREHGVDVLFTRAIAEVTRGLQAAGLTLSLTFSDAPEDQLPAKP